MFGLIFFAIILVIIYKYALKKNKNPEGLEDVPFISGLPVAWAYLRQRNYDEIGDLIRKLSGGHEFYLVCHMMHTQLFIYQYILKLY